MMKTPSEFLEFFLYNSIWLVSGVLIYYGLQFGLEWTVLPDWLSSMISVTFAIFGGMSLMGTFIELKKEQSDRDFRRLIYVITVFLVMIVASWAVALIAYAFAKNYLPQDDLPLGVFVTGCLSFMLILSIWLTLIKRQDKLAEQTKPSL